MFDEAKLRTKFIEKLEIEILPKLRKDFPNTRFAIGKETLGKDDLIGIIYQNNDLDEDRSFNIDKYLARTKELEKRVNEILPLEERIQICMIEDVLNRIPLKESEVKVRLENEKNNDLRNKTVGEDLGNKTKFNKSKTHYGGVRIVSKLLLVLAMYCLADLNTLVDILMYAAILSTCFLLIKDYLKIVEEDNEYADK